MQIVYEFGLRPPTLGEDTVRQQIKAAHHYYNELIALDREKREAYQQTMLTVGDIAALTAEVDALAAQKEAGRAEIQAMKGSATPPEEIKAKRKLVQDLAARLKEKRTTLKELKRVQREDPHIKSQLEAQKEATLERNRIQRKAAGLYWGTYQCIEAAVDAAKKSPRPPNFHRWSGEGMVGVHFQDAPMPATDLFHPNTMAWITPVPATAHDPSVPKGQRKRLCRTTLHLRVQSDPEQQPIWAEWPMILHRPFPKDATVTWIRVFCTHHADFIRWTAQVTLKLPDVQIATGTRMVGIDLGWRKQGPELRAAYWWDTNGQNGELRLPASIRNRAEKADAIRGVRDKNLDALKLALLPLLKGATLPADAQKTTTGLHASKSFSRFVTLWKRYGTVLPPAATDLLRVWYHRDRHLWQYETGIRSSFIAHRREQFRLFALHLANTYDAIALEDFNLPKVIVKPKPESVGEKPVAAHQRVLVAPGILRSIIEATARREGKLAHRVPCPGTTTTHFECGYDAPWTKEERLTLMHTCPKCGIVFDQDANAARNILALGVDLQSKGAIPTRSVARKPKWVKRHKVTAGNPAPVTP